MAFWNSEKLGQRLPALIDQPDHRRIKHGGYELSLGPEAFITSDCSKRLLAAREQLLIPPGQFGLLLSEEVVTVPNDSIGFISIKASVKFRGLVNVSGFHVDPGFKGRLKFSVYNAGSRNIVLSRGDPVFIIWFSDLNQVTADVYSGDHNGQMEISAEDIMCIEGEVASPASLLKKTDDLQSKYAQLEHTVSVWRGFTIGLLVAVGGSFLLLFVTLLFDRLASTESPERSTQSSVLSEPVDPNEQVSASASTENSTIVPSSSNQVTQPPLDRNANEAAQQTPAVPILDGRVSSPRTTVSIEHGNSVTKENAQP